MTFNCYMFLMFYLILAISTVVCWYDKSDLFLPLLELLSAASVALLMFHWWANEPF